VLGDRYDDCVLTCYCMYMCVYSSLDFISHPWSAFQARMFLFCVNLTVSVNVERLVCIKFCNKIRKTVAESHQLMQIAFGNAAVNEGTSF
jgi:hypothetical protein